MSESITVDLSATPIERIMSRQIVTVKERDDVRHLLEIMINDRVSAMPVVNDAGKLAGFISRTDLADELLRLDADRDNTHQDADSISQIVMRSEGLADLLVRELMNDRLVTIGPQASVAEACRLMNRHGIHHLMVVDGDRLVGIVSTLDVVRQVANIV